jgi:ABC-type multidrug transport system fused ATPase/permease subunit
MGNTAISLAAVQDLSIKTGLAPFIQSSKEGYDTFLDPLGKRLPQNIRQLILLNRALLGNYRLLLLEQPFQHLTASQKNNVLAYIKNEKSATAIIISEEENTAPFNQVIQLNAGSIQA